MVIFITSLRSLKKLSYRFMTTFQQTVASVCRQTTPEFRVVIVTAPEDTVVLSHPKIDVIKGPSSGIHLPPCFATSETAANERIRIDKGVKYLIGILHSRRYSPKFVSFFDCDDLISRTYAEDLLSLNPKTGWVLQEGFAYHTPSNELQLIRDFHKHCGTCLAMRAELFDFPDRGALSHEGLLREYGYQYITRVLGSHHFAAGLFSLTPQTTPKVIYRICHGDNSSKKSCRVQGGVPQPLTVAIRTEFFESQDLEAT